MPTKYTDMMRRMGLAALIAFAVPFASGAGGAGKWAPHHAISPIPALPAAAMDVANISAYYAAVDRRDFAAVMDRFADDAIYRREGWPDMVGRDAIADFFHNKRKLTGTHTVDPQDIRPGEISSRATAVPLGRAVRVSRGIFSGLLDGSPIDDLTFEDLWIVRESDGKVIFRQSWISKPGV
jgi:hypothetical protein